MARSYNRATILGNVGQAPEIRQTSKGDKVANFSVATSPPWDADKTEWHRVVAWRKLADIIEQYLSKGDRVFIEGRIQYNRWEDKNGSTRVQAEINAQNIVLLGGRRTDAQASRRNEPTDDELPF